MKEYAFQGDLDQYFNTDHALYDFRWPAFSLNLDEPAIKDKAKVKETALEAGFTRLSDG